VVALRFAYQTRNYERFSELLSTAQDGAPYFFVNDSTGTAWGVEEELRIHRRMFTPENPLPGETPVPPELWLASIDIHTESRTEWAERPEFYRSETNPAGLDPERWRATSARYAVYLVLTTQGPTNYQLAGPVSFVVVEDLAKQAESARKYLLYRWEDHGIGLVMRRLYAGPARAATDGAAAMPANHDAARF
jgi:hypothetical protein